MGHILGTDEPMLLLLPKWRLPSVLNHSHATTEPSLEVQCSSKEVCSTVLLPLYRHILEIDQDTTANLIGIGQVLLSRGLRMGN